MTVHEHTQVAAWLVRYVFGVKRYEPPDRVAISGDWVEDTAGVVSRFVGLGADRQPVLAAANAYDELRDALDGARLSWCSP